MAFFWSSADILSNLQVMLVIVFGVVFCLRGTMTAGELIADRIPVSLWFGIPGFFLTYLVCIPLGIAKALRRGTRFDLASSVVVFVGYAIPAFALGMVLKTLLCGTSEAFWDVLPLGGFESDGYLKELFRRRFGCSMRVWRNENRVSPDD